MIVLARGRFGPPVSRVLSQVRRSGVVGREDIAKTTGLSASTVARAIAVLVEAKLLRERPDLVPARTIGRPSIPVEVDAEHYATIGCHIGRRTTTVSLGDLTGRVVARTGLPTPSGEVANLARTAARQATRLLSEHPTRVAVAAGLVAPWGDIDYPIDETGQALTAQLGLPVETGDHISAIAAAEYSARPHDLPGVTAYVYARDTVGFAMAIARPAGTEISRAGRLSHFPIGGDQRCRCGRLGCLEALVSDQAVAARASAAGLVSAPSIDLVHRAAQQGRDGVHRLLRERAEALGRIAAIVRDMVHPDRVVLCGQGFTDYRPGLDLALASFRAATSLPPTDVSFTRFGGGVQAVAAGAVALRRVYAEPLDAVRADWASSPGTRPRGRAIG